MLDNIEPAQSATILIVDDTLTNLQVLLDALENAGYEVLVASSGQEALQRAELGAPDLILLDVVMPDMDGFETCRQLKAYPGLESIPVIFMTALSDIEDKLAGFNAGGVDYITKPLDHDEALARIRTHLTIRNLQITLETQNLQLQAVSDALTRFLRTDRSEDATSLLMQNALTQTEGHIGFVGLVVDGEQDRRVRVVAAWGDSDGHRSGQEFFEAMHQKVRQTGHAEYATAELESYIGPVISDGRTICVPDTSPARSSSGLEEDVSVLSAPLSHGEKGVTGLLTVVKYGSGFRTTDRAAVGRFAQTVGAIFECERLRRRQAESERRRERAEEQASYLQQELNHRHFNKIVGESQALQSVLRQAERVAKTDSTVLISGETGTGKELIARAIHDLSHRNSQPLISVNCAALPENLIESELFGHEKGAFTGATTMRKGRFEVADGGTLFLDEIGDMPLAMQIKLLRVLQEKELERVGGNQTLHVDVRVIAATNRDLQKLVIEGDFRQDLYYRLNVFPIDVPPLRERPEDIPELVHYFIDRFATKTGRAVVGITDGALEQLSGYQWPGNVRELENIVERAVILCGGDELDLATVLLPTQSVQDSRTGKRAVNASDALVSGYLDNSPRSRPTLEQIERDYIVRVLTDANWLIEGGGGAAEVLGLKASTLRSRMLKLGISKPVSR